MIDNYGIYQSMNLISKIFFRFDNYKHTLFYVVLQKKWPNNVDFMTNRYVHVRRTSFIPLADVTAEGRGGLGVPLHSRYIGTRRVYYKGGGALSCNAKGLAETQ